MDSHFANGKQKVGDILLAELESKLSPKPFSCLAVSRNKYKGLCCSETSGETGLRRAFALYSMKLDAL